MDGAGASAMLLLRLFLHYPELLLALASFFFLSLCLHFKRGRRNSSPMVNWPIVGMRSSILSHFDCLHDLFSKTLSEAGNNFMFKGPLFLRLDFLLTCDPANINHIFSSGFNNYPKGDDYREMFDVLGDSILTSDLESWKVQRKMAHAVLGDRKFRSFMVDSSLRKIRHGLVPFLDGIAQQGLVVDIQDVFTRYSSNFSKRRIGHEGSEVGVDGRKHADDGPINHGQRAPPLQM